jgi:hypothetical protein
LALSLREVVGFFEQKYNKYYIGCVVNGQSSNFIAFKPQKSGIRIDLGIKLTPDQITALEDANIAVLPYTPHWRVHPIKISRAQAVKPPKELLDIVRFAFNDYFG